MSTANDILSIFKKCDVTNCKEEDYDKIQQEIYSWNSSSKDLPGPPKLWIDVTTNLSSSICVSNLPTEKNEGIRVAKKMLEVIIDKVDDGENESGGYQGVYDVLFEMLIKMMELGPGSGHLALWVRIFQWNRFRDYYTALSKNKISTMLKTIQKTYYYSLDTDNDAYASLLKSALNYITDVCLREEIFKQNQEDLLDLFMFYETNFLKSDPAIYDATHTIGMKLWRKKPFQGVKNPDLYRKYIQDILNGICDDEVPKTDKIIKYLGSALGYVFNGILEGKLFCELYMEIMDLLYTVVYKTTGLPCITFVEAVGSFWGRITEDELKGEKAFIFDAMAPKLAEFLENLPDHSVCEKRLLKPALYYVLGRVMKKSKEHSLLWIRIMKAMLPIPGCHEACYSAIREQEKNLQWKNHPEEAKEIFQQFKKITVPYSGRDKSNAVSNYENFIKYFLEQIKKSKVIKNLYDDIADYCLTVVEENKTDLFRITYKVSDYYDDLVFKTHHASIMSSLKRVSKILRQDSEFDMNRCCTLQEIQCNAFDAMKDYKSLTDEDFEILVELCDAAISGEFIDPDNRPLTEHYRIYTVATMRTFKMMSDAGNASKASQVITKVVELLEHEEEEVVKVATQQIYLLSSGKAGPECLAPHLPKLFENFLESENNFILMAIVATYPNNGSVIEENLPKVFGSLGSGENAIRVYTLMLVKKVAEHKPTAFTKENVDQILEEMFEGEPLRQAQYLEVIQLLATNHVAIVLHILDTLLNATLNENCLYYFCSITGKIAVKSEQNIADKIVNRYVKEVNTENQNNIIMVLTEMRSLVRIHKPVVEKHKKLIQKIKDTSTNATVGDVASSLIDLLEGRSLETLADDLEQQQEDIEVIDNRVTTNENKVNEIKEDVTEQKKEIKVIKEDVKDQDKKLNELGEVVDDTVKKVEEIDQKTLSHAPYWSKDVSKLLNPKSDADWRLLSSRLGYSKDDIRAWAQQADPCMAMLNEWYTTHKTSEANFGVLTALQEMNRMDTAVLVENAMKAVEQVVEDEEFEYSSPPPIFLSYQWGHQEEVKLLRHHLELAGYDCWMDIGQMGGGDKLFEKIDKGIRSAKIIISCTTEKYAKSPNCNREVNLSVTLKKPIIPLLLEDCPWPPEGSMGPIFSEYLYIQFFQRDKSEATTDDRFWPIPKFQEILMQLSMNGIVPDETKVNKMYKNWWMPLVEDIKIDKSKTYGGGKKKEATAQSNAPEDKKSPEVFISYQWDKQKNVMLLYKRLTELGYHCWMDIHQMGGGDSLYDKIDRGIRGCQVVLSCVTEKYSLSANCRREVSLCDSLKRPIIPLLFENMSWPPKGPMSMAFTELLYIDFHSDKTLQEKWAGSKFEELKVKLGQYLLKPVDGSIITKESAAKVSKKLEEDPVVTKDKAKPDPNVSTNQPVKKSSYVKSAKPGAKSSKQTSEEHTPSQNPKSTPDSPSASPAHTGSASKPRPVRPTSAASTQSQGKSSRACTIS